MTQGITGFLQTWGPSIQSTDHCVEWRNIRQGGHEGVLLVTVLSAQAMWAGSLMAEVAAVVSGPLYAIAQFFRIVFFPLISFPLSLISCGVKSGFYSGSVKATAAASTKYYIQGDLAPKNESSPGTVTLLVDGVTRHFLLGRGYNTPTVEIDGKTYYYTRLRDGDERNDQCREITLKGERVWVRLNETYFRKKALIEVVEDGRPTYYDLEKEVPEPIQRTKSACDWTTGQYENYLLKEVSKDEFLGVSELKRVQIDSDEQPLYFELGREIDAPENGSYSFTINGAERHFATAQYVQRENGRFASGINAISNHWLGFSLLPDRFSRITTRALTFVNENLNRIIRAAILVAGAVFLYFGHMAMALGAILPVVYEYLDHDLGIIPHKVSLFMERWMPTVALAGLLIVGSGLTQIYAGVGLLLEIPAVKSFFHQKVATAVRHVLLSYVEPFALWALRKFGVEERPKAIDEMIAEINAFPRPEEFDAPYSDRKTMSAGEINEILSAGDDKGFELNPAILTKNVEPSLPFEEDSNFSQLIEFWDQLGKPYWESQYSFLIRGEHGLANDQRFMVEFLQKRFPEAEEFQFKSDRNVSETKNGEQRNEAFRRHEEQVDGWITKLAEEEGISKEEWVANYLRAQLQHYVDRLQGKKALEGRQKHLRNAMQNTARILPFLQKAQREMERLEPTVLQLLHPIPREILIYGESGDLDLLAKHTRGEPLNPQQLQRLQNGKIATYISNAVKEGTLLPDQVLALIQNAMKREEVGKWAQCKVDLADSLKNLAIYGDYCGLRLDKASGDVLKGFTHPFIVAAEAHLDPHQRFENGIFRKFREGREQGIDSMFHGVFDGLSSVMGLHSAANDIHFHAAFRKMLAQGFLPMTEDEQEEFTLSQLLINETLTLFGRIGLQKVFFDAIPEQMRNFGMDFENLYQPTEEELAEEPSLKKTSIYHNKTLNYLRNWVEKHPSLSSEDKEKLLNGPLLVNSDQLRNSAYYDKWSRLLLMVLGIWRKKVVQPVAQSEAISSVAAPNFVPAAVS